MPYMVKKVGKKYCVYKKGPDGEPEGDALGTHGSMTDAETQMAAIHAQEDSPSKFFLKALSMGEERRFGGILVPFGDDEDKDFDGEYFDTDTAEVDSWFKMLGAIPLLVDHDHAREILNLFGANIPEDAPIEGPIGRITKFEKTAEGWYAEGNLEAASDKLRQAYIDYVWAEIQKGKMNFSSTGWKNRIKKSKSGHIEIWPVVEGTATWRPANPKKTEIDVKSYKSALEFLHIPTIPLNEELRSEKLSEASEVVRHQKAAESIDEQSRRVYEAWDEQVNKPQEQRRESFWITERYPDYLIVCEGTEYYKVSYQMNDETIMFAPKNQWREVRRQWVEVPPENTDEMMMGEDDDMMKAIALAQLEILNLDVELLKHDLRRISC